MTSANGDRLDRIESLAISNARAIEALTQSVNTVAEASGRSLRAIDILAERAEEDRVNFREFLTRTDATLDSLKASIDRQDRILDYLIRHERDGNGGQPAG